MGNKFIIMLFEMLILIQMPATNYICYLILVAYCSFVFIFVTEAPAEYSF